MDAMKHDPDPQETREWLDARAGVRAAEGPNRAHYLIEALIDADPSFTERFHIAVIQGWSGSPPPLPHALDAARAFA